MFNEVARRRPRRGVMIDADQLEEVVEYKYLGRLITSGNEMDKEVDQRLMPGWRIFGEYSHFLKDSKTPICLKRKIMDMVILPVMTYGAETWTLTKLQERKMAVAQWSMKRSLLNIMKRGKIRNEVIRSKTKVVDTIDKVQCMRGQWAGHIAWMSNTRWVKITSEWTPREGRQARGRPKTKRRWRDSIEEVGGSRGMRVAQGSKCIMQVVEAICQQWHEQLRLYIYIFICMHLYFWLASLVSMSYAYVILYILVLCSPSSNEDDYRYYLLSYLFTC